MDNSSKNVVGSTTPDDKRRVQWTDERNEEFHQVCYETWLQVLRGREYEDEDEAICDALRFGSVAGFEDLRPYAVNTRRSNYQLNWGSRARRHIAPTASINLDDEAFRKLLIAWLTDYAMVGCNWGDVELSKIIDGTAQFCAMFRIGSALLTYQEKKDIGLFADGGRHELTKLYPIRWGKLVVPEDLAEVFPGKKMLHELPWTDRGPTLKLVTPSKDERVMGLEKQVDDLRSKIEDKIPAGRSSFGLVLRMARAGIQQWFDSTRNQMTDGEQKQTEALLSNAEALTISLPRSYDEQCRKEEQRGG